jgi:hypothetical protein
MSDSRIESYSESDGKVTVTFVSRAVDADRRDSFLLAEALTVATAGE